MKRWFYLGDQGDPVGPFDTEVLALDAARAAGLATDPPTSEAQRRAMWAAAEGRSTLGIPKKVGEEFVKDAAGTMATAPNGAMLFVRRAQDGFWGLPGGFVEDGEAIGQAADREAREETGWAPTGKARALDAEVFDGVRYTTVARAVDEMFTPTLDAESVDYTWAHPHRAPTPLHPGLDASFKRMFGKPAQDLDDQEWGQLSRLLLAWLKEERQEPEHADDDQHAKTVALKVPRWNDMSDADAAASARRGAANVKEYYRGTQDGLPLALDRANRHVDANGFLHVEVSHISKANVCPYQGSEIPGYEELGLDPEKVYQLYRDPEELAKAAKTFDNLPLMMEHVPVTPDEPEKQIRVGSTGTDATWHDPYVDNSLVVWDREGIDAVEDETQQELSCAYRYEPDMTPGKTPDGTPFDGVMRNIEGNHVALVPAGRVGPDVVVGDRKPSFMETHMPKSPLYLTTIPRRVATARGALLIGLKPLLAADQKLPNLTKLLRATVGDASPKAWRVGKPKLKAALDAAFKGKKFAKDADLTSVHQFIDSLDKPMGEDDPKMEEAPAKEDDEDKDLDVDELGVGRDSGADAVCELLKAHGVADDVVDKVKMLLEQGADADEPKDPKEPKDKDEPKAPGQVEDAEGGVNKPAPVGPSLSQVKKTAEDAARGVHERYRGLEEAREVVRPFVGALTPGAFDSAEQVYRYALVQRGGYAEDSLKGAPAGVLRAMVEKLSRPSAGATTYAADAAPDVDGFKARYGDVALRAM